MAARASTTSFPNVQYIRLPKNFGLTKALNLGWRAADAEYVLFLHDDTRRGTGHHRACWPPRSTPTPMPPPSARCWWTMPDGPRRNSAALPPPASGVPPNPSATEPFAVRVPRGAALMARVYFIKAIRQIDARYGQFGSDADLAAEIRRASRKILLVPSAARAASRRRCLSAPWNAPISCRARAVFLGKYHGFAAGLKARLASVLGPPGRLPPRRIAVHPERAEDRRHPGVDVSLAVNRPHLPLISSV